jgi:pyruvate,orthophosphate dikinase
MPVYGLDDAPALTAAELRQLLGGKGAGLVEMRKLGIPVPAGFVLGTPLCPRFLATGWPADLDEAVEAKLAALEQTTGQGFGDAETPLLVSVRSGAPVSMPGMMDTILNLGANQTTIAALAARTQNERFALDTWSRFSRMYAQTVLVLAEELGPAPPADASVGELRADVAHVHDICARQGMPIPDDPRTQLRGAIEAVFRSSGSARARVYREREALGEVPTAVVVQAMVFGNLGASSGTGVAFSRDPSTGANELLGDFLLNAQGEEVVSGLRISEPISAMMQHLPAAFDDLCRTMRRLERHYRDLCDVEFTVQEGRLHVLQVRVGKRSAGAAARIAVEMASGTEPLITREEAVRRVTREQLRQLQSTARLRDGATAIASGVAASPGVASGVICLHPDRVDELAAGGRPVILVRPTTSPEDVHGMVQSAGIVTATGGMVSHAALVARGWGIAAICGVGHLVFEPRLKIGDHELREGDCLTIDGGSGTIYLGDCAETVCGEPAELQTLRRWGAELGVELGCAETEGADAPSDEAKPFEYELSAFAVVRALALLGFASVDRLAVALVSGADAVRAVIDALPPGHVNATPRGLQIAPQGRLWLQAHLDTERDCVDCVAADRLYGRFMQHDDRFKRLITDWQMRTIDGRQVLNDHADAAYDASVRERLCGFHGEAKPLIDEICVTASRLKPFSSRFARAAEAATAGDGSMIASPLKDSYHTVWFELHEELMHLSGRSRAAEEAAATHRKT